MTSHRTEWELVSIIDKFVQFKSTEGVHSGSVITLPAFAVQPLLDSGYLASAPEGQPQPRVTIEVSGS